MKILLTPVAVAEAATGVALMVVPSVVARLLFGAELSGVAIVVARVTGIALLALGVACWPGRTGLCGLLTYNALVTLYLACVGLGGEFTGNLLWLAVGLHAIISILLGRIWLVSAKTVGRNNNASE